MILQVWSLFQNLLYLWISFILSNGKCSAMSTFIVHGSYITEWQNSTLMKHSLVENPSVCLFPLLQFTCWSDESLLTECAGWISSSTLLMEPNNFSFIVKIVTHFEGFTLHVPLWSHDHWCYSNSSIMELVFQTKKSNSFLKVFVL